MNHISVISILMYSRHEWKKVCFFHTHFFSIRVVLGYFVIPWDFHHSKLQKNTWINFKVISQLIEIIPSADCGQGHPGNASCDLGDMYDSASLLCHRLKACKGFSVNWNIQIPWEKLIHFKPFIKYFRRWWSTISNLYGRGHVIVAEPLFGMLMVSGSIPHISI